MTQYRQVGRRLVAKPVNDAVPNFFVEGDVHSIPELVRTWQPMVDAGGMLLGPFGTKFGYVAGNGNTGCASPVYHEGSIRPLSTAHPTKRKPHG